MNVWGSGFITQLIYAGAGGIVPPLDESIRITDSDDQRETDDDNVRVTD